MKIAKDIKVVGTDIQTNGGAAFFTRDFVDRLSTHPKMIEAYAKSDRSKLGKGYTIYIAEPDGSVTVLGDEVYDRIHERLRPRRNPWTRTAIRALHARPYG
ncbi:hypothetical protein [Rhizobium leguminosarum]|uniref:hypothetical protein n=1 Tax=Rhizobium leguminosarum TaxID=384 RepID=UPI003F9E2BFE